MNSKILAGFRLPSTCTHFLIVGPHYWGRGKTVEEALKNSEWLKARDVIGVLAGTETCHVDEMGSAFAKESLWRKAGT